MSSTASVAAASPATASDLSSLPSFVLVPLIDETFPHSGAQAKLEVLRTYPPTNTAAVTRVECIDFNRADSNAGIELECRGPWIACPFEKYDLLQLSGAKVEATINNFGVVKYKLILDHTTETANLLHQNWRDRVLQRTAKLFNLTTITKANKA